VHSLLSGSMHCAVRSTHYAFINCPVPAGDREASIMTRQFMSDEPIGLPARDSAARFNEHRITESQWCVWPGVNGVGYSNEISVRGASCLTRITTSLRGA